MSSNFFNLNRSLPVFLLLLGLIMFSGTGLRAQCPLVDDLVVTSTDITCNGANDGTITLTLTNANGYSGSINYAILRNPSAGLPPDLFSITTTDLTVTFTDLLPANYTIILTPNDVSCSPLVSPDLVALSQPAVLDATLDNVLPACTPGTGSIEISVSGGNGGYSYAWSGPTNPGDVEDPNGLDAGVYTVTVTDSKGCTVEILDIFVPVLTLADAGPDQVVCDNFATLAGNDYRVPGEIGTWSVVSGSGTFSDPNDPLATVSNLGEGTNVFEWFITDDAAICPGSNDQVSITWNNLQLNTPGDILLNCAGVNDGAGSFTVSGGGTPFSFTVDQNTTGATTSSSATSLDFSGAGPGIIEVTVTDTDGCSQTQQITITEPLPITIDNTSQTDITCFGGSDGTISITATGGTGALSYTLLPGGVVNATGAFTGLAAGDYTVEVTDINACGPVTTATITLADGPEILIDNIASTDESCVGSADGTITITASGGNAPLSYTLQPLNITNATGAFTGLAAGDYTVEVLDAATCGPVVTSTISIAAPAIPSVDDITVTPITCFGANDGTIEITVSGGSTPITYTINPGGISNTTGTFTGLSPGMYTIDIQESNGCPPTSTAPVEVTEPAEITISSTVSTDPLCFGAPEGSITVVASGGTGALSYTLQPGGVTNATGVFAGLPAGIYTVEVTDVNNCGPFTTAPVTITDPAEIVVDNIAATDVTCTGGTNGSIDVDASGGTGALTYTLQPGALSNATGLFDNLTPGTYTVEITDANNCGPVSTGDIEIIEPVLDLAVTDVTICDPAQGDVVITVSGTSNGTTYELQTTAGASLVPPVTGIGTGGDLDLVILQANAPAVTTAYQLVAQVPGCGVLVNSTQPVVTVSPAPDVTLAVSDAAACAPGTDPAVILISGSQTGVVYELTDLGGIPFTPAVTVAGNGGDATLTIPVAQLPAATTTYQVTASNGAGCTAILTDQPEVTITTGPTAVFQGDATVCQGVSADLLVDLTGTGPWDITYTDGVTQFTVTSAANPAVISVTPASTQTYDLVSVTDSDTGCTTTGLASSATVTVDPVTGDQVSFGTGDWIGYVYEDGPTGPAYPGRVDFDPSKYRGFINQPENFDLDLGNSLPLQGPDLCGTYLDNYSVRFKLRKDFPAGSYQITVGGDDGYRLSLDGGATFLIDNFSDHSYQTSTFNLCLDGNVDLVLEYYENGGIARVSFDAMLIAPSEPVSVTIAADQLPACSGSATTFTATAVNAGANPSYQWQVNGANVPGETSDTYVASGLSNGDLVQVVVTASAAVLCPGNNPATSNQLTYSEVTELTAAVTVSPDQDPACIGAPITFTANPVNSGAAPTFQWQLNGIDQPGETGMTYVSSSFNDGDLVSVVMTADPAITCIVNPVVVSPQVAVNIVTDLTASATISSSANPACPGSDITFTSSVADAGANPSYQWQVNGVDVPGETADTYTTAALADGDVITLIVTADPLASCVSNSPVTSNDITQSIEIGVPMTVDVSADQTNVCAGDLVTFTAIVTDGGAAPTYQWQVNGADVPGETGDTYAVNSLADGDMVTAIVTADPAAGCVTNSPLTSSPVTILVQDAINPTASISADQNPVCIGDVATYTLTIGDAGAAPTIQWQVNGIDVAGETGTQFTSAGLNDGDVITALVTADPSVTCLSAPDVLSNQLVLNIVNDLTASVSVAPDIDPVCIGDAVTFTASAANAGANPSYQWQVNGSDVPGETSDTYTSGALADGDQVTVTVTADPAATCVNNPIVTSAPYTISVVNSLNPAVTIAASQTTICAGNAVTFTASATEAGLNPSYQWQINGVPVAGATSDIFASSTLSDGDQVNVLLTADPASSCAPAGAVTSNVIDIFVRPAGDPACAGGIGCGAFVVEVVPVRPPCNMPDQGSLTFLISGGSGSYTVIVSDNNGFSQGEIGIANTPILFEDLTASDYQYTITDTNGNTCTLPFTLQNETILDAAVVSVTNSACFNEPDGSATIEILSGGNAPYEYSLDGILWNQALTSVFTVNNLSAADSPIGILIRDDVSDVCPEEVFVTIDNLYPEIQASISTEPVETCDGTEGSVSVAYPPVGGNSPGGTWEIALTIGNTAPSSFEPFTANRDFIDLAAGGYTVHIRDEGGCVKRLPVIVGAPGQVNLVVISTSADCSNDGRSGGLQMQVTNTIEIPGPYRLTIEALSGPQSGEVIYQDLTYNGGFLKFDTLISATYQVEILPTDPDLCPTQTEVTISGGPVPVYFDYSLMCAGGTNRKQLLLTDIAGTEGTSYTLRVYDNLTSTLVEEIPFVLNIGNQFLIENYFFLTINQEYRLRLVQSPSICSGTEVVYDHPDNLLIPTQLLATVGETTKSLPDRATGTMQITNFSGGLQPSDNAFPYLTAIVLDSAAVPGQSFSTDFDTVRLNQNLDFEKIYEDIPAGRYRIFVMDQLGCAIELVGRVPLDTDIFIPNIFTPNGDGANETFYIRNKPDDAVELLVSNRWGKRVYHSDDYQNNWDGDDLPDGVYFYSIRAGDQEFKGWVEILRSQ